MDVAPVEIGTFAVIPQAFNSLWYFILQKIFYKHKCQEELDNG